jgi:FdhD protein
VHAAAVCGGDGTVVAFAEDVGRHNAVDKVVGSAALNGVSLGECFVASTGRLTGDIVLKAARVGIPIVASLAAALDSGIVVAKEADLTLIGFVRGKRMNVYSSVRRVVV